MPLVNSNYVGRSGVVNLKIIWITLIFDYSYHPLQLYISARPFVHRVGVVITDGRSASPEQTKAQAELARAEGITLMAIGFGSNIFQ